MPSEGYWKSSSRHCFAKPAWRLMTTAHCQRPPPPLPVPAVARLVM